MVINIVNKHKVRQSPKVNDVYIGRGSPLGNPWPISHTEDRDTVCDKYAEYILVPTLAMQHALEHIQRVALTHGSVNLVCFCAPARCHGESIKKAVLALPIKEEPKGIYL